MIIWWLIGYFSWITYKWLFSSVFFSLSIGHTQDLVCLGSIGHSMHSLYWLLSHWRCAVLLPMWIVAHTMPFGMKCQGIHHTSYSTKLLQCANCIVCLLQFMSCFSAIQQVSQLQLMSRNHHLQTVKVSEIRCY